MKEIIRQAIGITNSKIAFIPFLALIGITIYDSSNITFFSGSTIFLGFIFNIILYSIIYGSCIESVKKSQKSTWKNLLSTYWVDYFLIELIFMIVAYILYLILGLYLAGIIIGCLSIFVIPMVLLRRKVLSSLYPAVKIVFQKLSDCIPLFILIVLTFVFKYIAEYIAFKFAYGSTFLMYVIAFVQSFANAYIHLVIFCVATIILIEQKLWVADTLAEENNEVLTRRST